MISTLFIFCLLRVTDTLSTRVKRQGDSLESDMLDFERWVGTMNAHLFEEDWRNSRFSTGSRALTTDRRPIGIRRNIVQHKAPPGWSIERFPEGQPYRYNGYGHQYADNYVAQTHEGQRPPVKYYNSPVNIHNRYSYSGSPNSNKQHAQTPKIYEQQLHLVVTEKPIRSRPTKLTTSPVTADFQPIPIMSDSTETTESAAKNSTSFNIDPPKTTKDNFIEEVILEDINLEKSTATTSARSAATKDSSQNTATVTTESIRIENPTKAPKGTVVACSTSDNDNSTTVDPTDNSTSGPLHVSTRPRSPPLPKEITEKMMGILIEKDD